MGALVADLTIGHAGLDYLRLLSTGPMFTREVREHVFGPDWHDVFSEYIHVEDSLIRHGLAVFECWVTDPKCAITAAGDQLLTNLELQL